jgi:hypothetical protein
LPDVINFRNGKVAIAPKNNITLKIEQYLKNYDYEVWYFNSKKEI